jgi:tetratricopeptide (TPR) repeat protein
MKALSLLRFGLPLLLSPALLAQTPAPAPGNKPAAKETPADGKKEEAGPAPEPIPELRGAEKLTNEQKKLLVIGMGEVSNYIRGVRNLEALAKLDEIEQAVGANHYIENLRGAVYTKMRNFKKARTNFQKALDLAKGMDQESFHPKFNLAELDFVEAGNAASKLREVPPAADVDPATVAKQWETARDAFIKLLKDPGKGTSNADTLINFKIFICHLQLKRTADADVLKATFDQFDQNSPAYYYATAVEFFVKGDKEQAQEWLDSAKRIYPREMNEVYNDSLVELGWLETLQ